MYDRQRHSARVTFPQPPEGRIGRRSVFVIDVSLGGIRVAQQDKTLAIGQPRKVTFEWNGRRASFMCELRWLHPQQRLGTGSYGRNIYHAGYQVINGTAEAYDIVREILRESHVPE